MKQTLFNHKDVISSHRCLGHHGFGHTQLIAFHKRYVPGMKHYFWNLENKTFPKIWYVESSKQVLAFVEKYYKEHTCCYGVNPRPSILKSRKGYARSAKEDDIKVVTNFFIDIDFAQKEPSDEQIAELRLYLIRTEDFFANIGAKPPMINMSGNGYHLLFSPAPIFVNRIPDIKQRLARFHGDFKQEFERGLARLGTNIDNTMDLSRVVKVYGTGKPGAKRISRFEGNKRFQDNKLREYLLSLDVSDNDLATSPVTTKGDLPVAFVKLLYEHETLRNLWDGIGKTEGDMSRSGYDFSIIKFCLSRGITDLCDLHTILALRPKGSICSGDKGEQYIRATIANAIRL